MGQEIYLAVLAVDKHISIDCLIYTALHFDKDGLNLRQTAESSGALPFHSFLSRETGQQWYEPADGLKTVQTLSGHLQNLSPTSNDEAELVKWCLESLREIQQSLLAAEQSGAKFHFAFTRDDVALGKDT